MSFDDALKFTLKWEGGYSNHPNDKGGSTMMGITQRAYDEWRRKYGQSLQCVKLLSHSESIAIYRGQYWNMAHCNDWPEPLDMVVFDIAVNSGPGTAIKWLQQIIGSKVDGVVGPDTRSKVASAVAERGVKDVARSLCDRREDFYRQLCEIDPKQSVFLAGWMNRLNGLRKEVGV